MSITPEIEKKLSNDLQRMFDESIDHFIKLGFDEWNNKISPNIEKLLSENNDKYVILGDYFRLSGIKQGAKLEGYKTRLSGKPSIKADCKLTIY